MNSAFERYIGIDYSGAQTPASSLKGLRVYEGGPDYSFRRLANHFSRIAWLGDSIVVKATPIPEFGWEWATLPEAARLVPPWVILSETLVPPGNGLEVYT
jgi:hypothetical protein